MLKQYEPNVDSTISFLKLLNVKVNNSTVNETLQNHPDWPSLLCISDSLNKWNIPNAAGKIKTSDIYNLPTPFLAYTYDNETPLAIVTKVSDTSIEVIQKKYSKKITESKEGFLQKWNGIYLIAEPHENSGETNYEVSKRKEFLKSLIHIAAFVVLVMFSMLLITKIIVVKDSAITFSITGFYLQYLTLLSGIIVTMLLLWYEMDKNNPMLQKVCTGIAKGNCNAILSSKQAKLFNWLSWSEVGFFYFSGGLLVLLFAENAIANSIGLIAWLNILALPYSVFSIYYQWRTAKQWCVLCLAVQALLVLGAINVVVNNFLFPFPYLSFELIVNIVLLFLLPVLLWYTLKPQLLNLQEAKNTKREYLRIKFNTEIFDALLKKQKPITTSAEGLGITLGNPVAANQLIKVCNPYCGPCAKAHIKIESLIEQHNNLHVRIIFTATNDKDDIRFLPVKHFLAIAENKNETTTKEALDYWYLSEKKEYDDFSLLYPMNGELVKQENKIEAMDKWCKEMDVKATPTIFLNGYQLPDAYNIEDLKYFLLE